MRNTQRIPFNTSFGSRGGLPRPSCLFFEDETKCLNRAHCSFVSSIHIVCYIFSQMSRFIFEMASNEKVLRHRELLKQVEEKYYSDLPEVDEVYNSGFDLTYSVR